MKKTILFLLSLSCSLCVQAQFKTLPNISPNTSGTPRAITDLSLQIDPAAVPPASVTLQSWAANFQPLPVLQRPGAPASALRPSYTSGFRNPIALEGLLPNAPEAGSAQQPLPVRRAYGYLEAIAGYLRINDPLQEFVLLSEGEGKNGDLHLRFQQQWNGKPVHGAQLSLHLRADQVYLMTGRSYPSPVAAAQTANVSVTEAKTVAWSAVHRESKVIDIKEPLLPYVGGQIEHAQLVYFPTAGGFRLVWDVEVVPNLAHRHQYFIDAITTEVVKAYGTICGLHGENLPPDGPATTDDTDLNGQLQEIHSYQLQDLYYLIDASRAMYDGVQSNIPQDPVGAIITADAQNKSPQNDNFEPVFVTSGTNNFSANAVSAHFNAGEAYEYFRTTFNRNSINGQGGSIYSFINVTDEFEDDFDNAFWNGFAMFYGNGKVDFVSPLARSLDVAGHEMSHGVIQSTANLEYFGESGAMNESFADIFGAMIDRDDWQLGEDVVNTNTFPTGALRDMSNPNNGGSGLGSPGWQPKDVSEQFTGSQDNGGVHINSGILNRAFFLFATQVGKEVAEQVYYNALDNYLVRSSQFIDLRIAVIASANELFNSSVANAAANAFDTVQIFDGEGGDFDEDLGENPGDEHVLFADANLNALRIITPAGLLEADPLINEGILSKPSVSDDGSLVVYVNGNKQLRLIEIDWENETATATFLNEDTAWRNVAISKDGQRLAALTDDFDNRILIFNLANGGNGLIFQLFNPTTADGISTGDVVYADFMEWDASGQFLMYDALSRISNSTGDIEFWDIGFIRAWNNATNDFGDGFITKLFSGLPDNASVGNPSFAKNSPEVITLDFFDSAEGLYSVLGVNSQTGDVATMWDNPILGYPNYSVDDSKVIFNAQTTGNDPILAVVELADDHITPLGNATIFYGDAVFTGAIWGTWFADGNRDLMTDVDEQWQIATPIQSYPNPFTNELTIQLENTRSGVAQIQFFDVWGRSVYQMQLSLSGGSERFTLPLADLPAGTYFLRVNQGARVWKKRLVKM